MAYLIDTNIFIEAKNEYYAFDIAPSFWPALLNAFQKGQAVTIDAVADEIQAKEDNLAEWFAKNVKNSQPSSDKPFILSAKSDENVVSCYSTIASNVIQNSQYSEDNKRKFLDAKKADPWIIAAARTWGYTLVTNEKLAGTGTKKVKIPNICQQMNVTYTNLYAMMRDLHIQI